MRELKALRGTGAGGGGRVTGAGAGAVGQLAESGRGGGGGGGSNSSSSGGGTAVADGSAAAAVVDVESREVELWEQVQRHGIGFPPLVNGVGPILSAPSRGRCTAVDQYDVCSRTVVEEL